MLHAFYRAPGGKLGIAIIILIAITVIIGPPLLNGPASQLDFSQLRQAPSPKHFLGTDALGRDLLARLIVASRLSILLAIEATLLGTGIGMVWGSGVTLLRGRARAIGLRTIDAVLAFPAVLVAIFVGAIAGPGSFSATLGVAIGLSFSAARVTSNLALSVANREYVQAARIMGVRAPRLIWRHILPNIGETLAITTTVALSASIVALSTLSFLGMGVQAPAYDWGALLTQGVMEIYSAPAAAAGPAVAIAVVALAFGFVGESLARAMNPVLWRSRTRAVSAVASASPETAITSSSTAVAELEPSTRSRHSAATPVVTPGSVLEVRGLTVSFHSAGTRINVVDGVSFSVARGEMVGIAGESGSGKTMTAMAVAGLVPHPGSVAGSVRLDGKDVIASPNAERRSVMASKLAVVFQDPMSSLNPALTVGRQLTEAVEIHRGVSHREAMNMAEARLRELNVPAPKTQLHRYPHELSGGMRQRVMIAMGLMHAPALLIADEPTTSLDLTIQAQLMDLLHRINEEHGMAILLISHNLGLLSQNCSRVMTMYAGRIVEDGPSTDVLLSPQHPYTRALLAATPRMRQARDARLESIPGQPPDFNALPTGCVYHPRCPLAIDLCRVESPALEASGPARRVACWMADKGG